jgi:type IV pilus assembly protein PilY1
MFKDRSIGFTYSGSTIAESNLYDATANLIQDGSATERAAATTTLAGLRGWYITLGTGEKVVSSSVTLGNATYFNTNRPVPPAPGVCTTNLGEARQYTVSFLDGSAVVPYNVSAGLSAASRYQLHAGGGFLPSPVPVIAEIGGRLYQTVIVGTTALMPPTSPLQARIRTFWYRR